MELFRRWVFPASKVTYISRFATSKSQRLFHGVEVAQLKDIRWRCRPQPYIELCTYLKLAVLMILARDRAQALVVIIVIVKGDMLFGICDLYHGFGGRGITADMYME